MIVPNYSIWVSNPKHLCSAFFVTSNSVQVTNMTCENTDIFKAAIFDMF